MDYLHIPAYDNLNLIQNPVVQLDWLNTAYDEESYEAIRQALKRKEFGFARDPSSSRTHYLEFSEEKPRIALQKGTAYLPESLPNPSPGFNGTEV